MSFWDSSALVPVLIEETQSTRIREAYHVDSAPTVWWATSVECISALARRRRERELSSADETGALRNLRDMAAGWAEVGPAAAVRNHAERVVRVHVLSAGDAFQLAAALVWAEQSPTGRELVTLDQRLREAALREGFTVLPERV